MAGSTTLAFSGMPVNPGGGLLKGAANPGGGQGTLLCELFIGNALLNPVIPNIYCTSMHLADSLKQIPGVKCEDLETNEKASVKQSVFLQKCTKASMDRILKLYKFTWRCFLGIKAGNSSSSGSGQTEAD